MDEEKEQNDKDPISKDSARQEKIIKLTRKFIEKYRKDLEALRDL